MKDGGVWFQDGQYCVKLSSPENDFKECIKRVENFKRCKARFWQSRTVSQAKDSDQAYRTWRNRTDSNWEKKESRLKVKNAIENEKMKLNAILSQSWKQYDGLAELHNEQSKSINKKHEYIKSLNDIKDNNQQKLDTIITGINLNTVINDTNYSLTSKHSKKVILSYMLITTMLLCILVAVFVKFSKL